MHSVRFKRIAVADRCDNHHSGIKFLTPAQRHAGRSEEILQKRHDVYEAAKAAPPERWNGRDTWNWDSITEVWLNPDKVCNETITEINQDLETLVS